MNTFSAVISSISSKATILATLLLTALLPFFFVPFAADLFDSQKRLFVIFLTLTVVVLFALKTLTLKKLQFSRTPWTIPFLLLIISTIISIYISRTNRVGSLTGQGGFLISLGLFYILATTLIERPIHKIVMMALSITGVLLSLVGILERLGLRADIVLNGLFDLKLPEIGLSIFPTGGPFLTVSLLVVSLCATTASLFPEKKFANRVFLTLASAIIVVGALLGAERLLPDRPQSLTLLPFSDNWSIALDVIKDPKSAIFGVGPDGFSAAFSTFRPVRMNQQEQWFLQFSTGSNLPLDVIVTHGALGLAVWVFFALSLIAILPKARKEQLPLLITTAIVILSLLLFPPTIISLSLLTVLLIAWAIDEKVTLQAHGESMTTVLLHGSSAQIQKKYALPLIPVICFILILAAGAGFFFAGKVLSSSLTFGSALKAARFNDVKATYDLTVKAIGLYPYNDNLRRYFAATNLGLAQAITQKKDLSEEDRKTVVKLIQQAINEGKIAANLNPTATANWETLANVYQNLIGLANQADQWAVAAQVQAIQSAPTNPSLRFALGSIYRRTQKDEQALRMFEQTIQLKSDFANAYYNISDIYKARGDKQRQLAFLEQTLKLIKTTSKDYEKLKTEADALRKEVTMELEKNTKAKVATPSAQLQATPAPKARDQVLELKTPAPATSSAVKIPLTDKEGIASPSAVPEIPKQ